MSTYNTSYHHLQDSASYAIYYIYSYDVSGDEKKNNKYIPIVVGTVLGSVFLAAIFFGLWIIRGRVMRGIKTNIQCIPLKVKVIGKIKYYFAYAEA